MLFTYFDAILNYLGFVYVSVCVLLYHITIKAKFVTVSVLFSWNSFLFVLFQSTPVGTTIFRNIQAQDQDAGVNGLVEYFLVEGSQNISVPDTLTAADGYGVFAISYPHQGQVSDHFVPWRSLKVGPNASFYLQMSLSHTDILSSTKSKIYSQKATKKNQNFL